MSRFCTNCGAKLEDGAKFCVECGYRVPENDTLQDVRPAEDPLVNEPHEVNEVTEVKQPKEFKVPADIRPPAANTYGGQNDFTKPAQPTYSEPPQPAYQAPAYGGAAAALSAGGIKELLFSTKGRMNRKPYFLCMTGTGIISSLGSYLIDSTSSDIVVLLSFLAVIAVTVSQFMLVIKRCHDLNKSGWMSLILLIPLVGFFFALYLLFAKGTDGYNKYGPDPLQS